MTETPSAACRRRRRRATAAQGPPPEAAAPAQAAGPEPVADPARVPVASVDEGTQKPARRAARKAVQKSAVQKSAAPKSAAQKSGEPRRGAGRGANGPREHGERGLRDLVGGGQSQLGVQGALRARDVNRPTEQDLADAERDVVIVRRNWRPD